MTTKEMIINDLFKAATKEGASDLHIIVGKPPILRIDGELKIMDDLPVVTKELGKRMIFGILTDRQREKFIKDRELDISYEITEYSRYRVNLHWEKDNVGLVARVISTTIPSIDDLGLPQIVYDMVARTSGLI